MCRLFLTFFLISFFSYINSRELIFTSCGNPGWSCYNKTDQFSLHISSVVYECEMTAMRYRYNSYNDYIVYYGENITLDLNTWPNLTLESVEIYNCHSILLTMHTNFPSSIKKLNISNVEQLNLVPRKFTGDEYHPHNILFRGINLIPSMPNHFITNNETQTVIIEDAIIDQMSQKAINLRNSIKAFRFSNVTVLSIKEHSLSVTLDREGSFVISRSQFPVLRPTSITVSGGSVSITNSNFTMVQEASIVVKTTSLNMTHNNIRNFKRAVYIESSDIVIEENTFFDSNAADLVYWNKKKNEFGGQITFHFIKNRISSSNDEQKLGTCMSKVSVLTRNCSGPMSLSEYLASNLTNSNAVVVNLLVCDNKFEFEIPATWYSFEAETCNGL